MAGINETAVSWVELDELDRAEGNQVNLLAGDAASTSNRDVDVIIDDTTVAGGLAVTVSEVVDSKYCYSG